MSVRKLQQCPFAYLLNTSNAAAISQKLSVLRVLINDYVTDKFHLPFDHDYRVRAVLRCAPMS